MSLSWSVMKYNRITRGLILYKNASSSCGCNRRVINSLRKVQSDTAILSCSFQPRQFCNGVNATKLEKSKSNELDNCDNFKDIQKQSINLDTADQEGSKKILRQPLPDKYEPEYVESGWYPWWEKNHFFKPKAKEQNENNAEKTVFMMCLPPPNVTGVLHLGHALTCSVQDAIVRWNRMRGRETLWNPGSDHAGISTQVVVEKQLYRDQQVTRHDLGRERFMQHVWAWKHQKGSQIYEQMRRLGASLDWSRDCFTLDPKLEKAVNEAFVRLYDEGLIYRSHRMVNWCPALRSAISDVEVDNIPLEGRTYLQVPGYQKKVEFGVLHSFAYPVEGSDEKVVVATTRIETMLGDTAVCVHPHDSRYTHLHGKFVQHPLTGTKLPIICDEFVDREFGTGAVKITPAHDQTDHAVGQRHGLPSQTIIDDTGHMTGVPEQFMGLNRFEARSRVVAVLKEKGLYRDWQDNNMVLPLCSRTGDVIEPKLKEQWFVDCNDMADQAIQAVKDKDLKIIPDDFEKHWFHWLENIKDWCISRQLWWGHRIPAYRVTQPQTEDVRWFVGRTEGEAAERASRSLNVPISQIKLQQDDDVLDTWFSSALFPFSIFGWPDQGDDLRRFYPNSMLETAHDILFFWVARMVMMATKLTGQLPFNQVLLHGILRDAQGRKMSKSLGNVINPMDVIHGTSLQDLWKQLEEGNLAAAEVKKARKNLQAEFPDGITACGTDALRFTLCSYNIKAHYINMNIQHVKKNRRLCNKLWQAFRYISDNVAAENYTQDVSMEMLSRKLDLWILSRLAAMVMTCDGAFSTFDLHHATAAIEEFWISEFCDVYLEYSKMIFQSEDDEAIRLTKAILHKCMDVTLRAASPFMPYITEELYQRLPPSSGSSKSRSVCVAAYPHPEQYDYRNLCVEADVAVLLNIVEKSLQLRSLFNLTKARAAVYISTEYEETYKMLEQCADAIRVLSRSSSVHQLPWLHRSSTAAEDGDVLFSTPVERGVHLHMQLKDVVEHDKAHKYLTKKKQQIDKKMKEAAYLSDSTWEKVKTLQDEQDLVVKALAAIEQLR